MVDQRILRGEQADIGDRLLLSMTMNARTRSRLDLEQPAPQRRLNAELRRDRGQAHGACCLCRSRIKSGRADNANWGILAHRNYEWLLVGNDRRPQLDALLPLIHQREVTIEYVDQTSALVACHI